MNTRYETIDLRTGHPNRWYYGDEAREVIYSSGMSERDLSRVVSGCQSAISRTGDADVWCPSQSVLNISVYIDSQTGDQIVKTMLSDPEDVSDTRRRMFGRQSSRGRKPRPVIQTERNTGSVIREWESISQASETLGINLGNIHKCLRGERSHASGYGWRYADE